MTDFLSNLAARTLNLMPVIQPRPLTAFEPWPSDGALGARRLPVNIPIDATTFDGAPDHTTSEHAVSPSAHELAGEGLNQLSLTMPAPSNQSTQMAASPLSPSNFTTRSIPPRDPAAPLIERDVSSTISPERPAPLPAVVAPNEARHPAEATPTIKQVIVEREQIDREPEKPPVPVLTPQTVLIEKPAAPMTSPLIVQPVVERVIDRREDIAPSNRSRDVQSSAPQMTTNEVPQESPAPPVIHVTIGRVEVRATTTPASPRRAAHPTSTLSLEEYLRSRNGGRR